MSDLRLQKYILRNWIDILERRVYTQYMVTAKQKPISEFKLKKRDRDTDIKLFWQALPQSRRNLDMVAKYFRVSISTVWYAIHGRKR